MRQMQEGRKMDARSRKKYRRRLLDELGQRGRLLGKMRRSVTERGEQVMRDGGIFASHMAEQATEEADRESDYLLCDEEGRHVQEIEEALRRIDEGIYGACESCGDNIDRRRLEVLPSARFCLPCQERHERFARN